MRIVEGSEKVEEDKKEADQQPAPVAKAEKQATEIAEESKKEEKPAGKKTPKKKSSTKKLTSIHLESTLKED